MTHVAQEDEQAPASSPQMRPSDCQGGMAVGVCMSFQENQFQVQ